MRVISGPLTWHSFAHGAVWRSRRASLKTLLTLPAGQSSTSDAAMAPAEGGRRLLNYFNKPLLLFPCCGSNQHITAPGSQSPHFPSNNADTAALEPLASRDRFRPSVLQTRDEPLTKCEDASDTHPYHCPICFYFFSGVLLFCVTFHIRLLLIVCFAPYLTPSSSA